MSVLEDFSLNPLLCSSDSLDHTACLLGQKSGPVLFSHKNLGIADNYKPMLGSSNTDIDPVLFLNETARTSPHHGHENQVEFSTLRTVN